MARGFNMDCYELAARGDIQGREQVWVLDHQVRLEHDVDKLAAGLHHVGPNRQVRHEYAVHDVPVDAVGRGFLERLDLVTEATEVGGENRGRYFDGTGVG